MWRAEALAMLMRLTPLRGLCVQELRVQDEQQGQDERPGPVEGEGRVGRVGAERGERERLR